MIKGREFQKFETELLRKEKVNIEKNFHIVEALYEEAVALGLFPLKDPLEGLEVDIRMRRLSPMFRELPRKIARCLNKASIPYMVIGGLFFSMENRGCIFPFSLNID